MRIGLDGRLLNRHQNTGISRYTEFLLEYYIQKYGKSAIKVITNDPLLKIDNCQIIYTKYKPYSLVHFLLYMKFICSLNFDIFHIPFYSGFFSRLPNTQVIVTVHDLMYRLVVDFFGKNALINKLKVIYFDFIVSHTIKNAANVISVSKTTKFDLYNLFKISSTLIPEYSEILKECDISIIDRLALHSKKYFFYCGNNRSHKNLQFVISLFNAFPELHPLVLAGKGHVDSPNVIVAGIVTEKELGALYENAIALVFPSKYEGFGLPILEALSVKTPVVASRTPAFLEFKSKNIVYFNSNDSNQLLEALQSIQQHQFISEDEFFEEYSPQRIYDLLDSLFLSMH
jgi:glycosyltransferase involved in cell wall biosynthesis